MTDHDETPITDNPEEESEALRRSYYGFPDSPTVYEVKRWGLQEAFLAAYPDSGGIYKAAVDSGCSDRSHENWLQGDSFGYQKRFEIAKAQRLELMEIEADRRGIIGIDHPVVHQGVITDTYKTYSDNLLMFRMKRLDPAYRDNYTLVLDMPDDLRAYLQAKQTQDQEARKALPEPKTIEHQPKGQPAPWESE